MMRNNYGILFVWNDKTKIECSWFYQFVFIVLSFNACTFCLKIELYDGWRKVQWKSQCTY